jgi:hypothetical protein
MVTKAQLLEQAEDAGLDVPDGATKADIEELLAGQEEKLPSLTGNPAAIPSEPDRGGLNELERKLTGVQ